MEPSSRPSQMNSNGKDTAAGLRPFPLRSYDGEARQLWNTLRNCKEFNECRREILACIKAPAQVFSYFYYFRTNAEAKEFTDALHMSIHFVPPEDVWNAIVEVRRHPKYSFMRDYILSQMSKLEPVTVSRQGTIRRQSDMSGTSRGYRSAISLNSTRTSGISTNTSFSLDENVEELGMAHCSSASEKVLPELPLAPARGYRKAPAGQCFVCPLRECKSRWAYKRVGDYLNHMNKEHPSFPPHDPSNYLRKDLRVSVTPIEVKGEVLEEHSIGAPLQSPSESYPDIHALSDADTHHSEQHVIVDDFETFPKCMPVGFDDMSLNARHNGSTYTRPFFGEVTGISQFHVATAQQQQSYFYHEDEMQTG